MLITKDSEAKGYDKLMHNFKVDSIITFLEAAENTFIREFMSRDQFNDLTTAYENSIKEVNPEGLSQKNIDLIHQVRRPLVQFALGLGTSSLALNVNQNGMSRPETEGKKSAFQYQELNWKRDRMNFGYLFLEDLGTFLEENLDDYAHYANSTERKLRAGLFVGSAKILREEVGLEVGQLVFTRIVPQLKKVEKLIKKITGITLFNAIKAEIINNSFTAENAEALELIRTAAANIGLAKGIVRLRLKVDGQGVTMVYNEKTRVAVVRKPVSDGQATDLISALLIDGNEAMAALNELINPVVVEDNQSSVNSGIVSIPGAVMT
jgi:hypothetical protein